MPFLWGPDGDGHLFWDCPFPPLVAIRESPEFHDVVSLDKSFWPRCLLWHGWLPALSGSDFGSPWAEGADAVASKRLEVALGSYVVEGYRADHDFLIGGDPRELAAAPDVWSDGSLVVHEVSGIGVAGCGVYAHASGAAWFGRMWGHLDLLPPLPDGAGEACRLYFSVPGPLQTVQRAEIWGFLVALQGRLRLHVGVDNLNVVNHLAGIIAGRRVGRPFSLVNDGDLLLLVQQLVRWRGSGSSAVTKVKGHADEGLVAQGRVREVDRIGNNEADAAADLGRMRVHHSISEARRLVNKVACAGIHWCVSFIASSSPWPGRRLMMMDWLVLLCILWSGRLLLTLSVGRLSVLFVILPGFLGLLGCGLLDGFRCLLLVLERLMLGFGLFFFQGFFLHFFLQGVL